MLNVDEFIRWLAVNTVIQNWDTYGNMAHNYYLYSNPADGGRIYWIPWDNNMALSSGMGGMFGEEGEGTEDGLEGNDLRRGMGTPLSLDLSEVDDNWPLIRYLMDDPEYWDIYVFYVQEVIETIFEPEATKICYQEAHDLIAPYAVGPEGEQTGYTQLSSPEAFDTSLEQLFDHVDERYLAVLEFLENN